MNLKSIQLYLLSSLLLVFIVLLYKPSTAPIIKSKQEGLIALKLDKELVNVLAVGQQRLLSSFFWIESMLNADHEHHNDEKDMSALYYKYKTIVDLDPYFYELYYNGGIYLSIIKDDEEGATRIYERGLSIYPEDYYLLMNTGFHYYFELGDSENSQIYFQKVLDLHSKTAPTYITVLLAKMKAQNEGGLEAARLIIYETWKNSPEDSPQRKKLFHRLYAIQAEMDLECLNNSGAKCNPKDIEGNPYILKDGSYVAQKPWKKFRLKKRKNKN